MKEFVYYSVPSIVALGIGFLTNILIAKIIGPEAFGQYNLVISYSQLWLILTSLGLSTATIKYISEVHRKKISVKVIASTSLVLTFVASMLAFLIMKITPRVFLSSLGVNSLFWEWSIFLALLLAGRLLFSAIIKGKQLLVPHGVLDLISALFWAASLVLLIQNPGLEFAFVITLIHNLIFILFGIFLLKGVWARPKMKVAKKLLGFSIWVVVGSVLSFFSGYFDRLVVERYLGVQELGIYSAYAFFSLQVVGYLCTVVVGYLFPKITALKGKQLFLNKINSWLWLIFPSSVAVLIVVIRVGFFVLGTSYPFVWPYSFWFALAGATGLVWQVRVPVMQSLGPLAMRFGTLTSIVNTGAGILVMLLATPRVGFLGLILGQMTISLGAILFQNYYFKHHFDKYGDN